MKLSLWPLVGPFVYWLARAFMVIMNAMWWRTDVVGAGNVPREGGFVLAPVHRSNIDGPLVATLTRRRMRYLAKQELFKFELPAKLFRSMGAISVNREKPDRASLNYCKDEMDKGWPLVLFPEGARKYGPAVDQVEEGAAFLALRSNVPIVPVAIAGTELVQKRNSPFLAPKKIRIVVGEPMLLPKGDGSRVSRAEITEGTALLQARLQELQNQASSGSGFKPRRLTSWLKRSKNKEVTAP